MAISRFSQLELSIEWHWKVYYIYVAGVTYYLAFMACRQKAPYLEQIYIERVGCSNSMINSLGVLFMRPKIDWRMGP